MEATSGFIDSGEDTITTTAGVDTIEVTMTDVEDFVHGTDTDLGLGTATAESSTGEAAAFNYDWFDQCGRRNDG